MVCSPFSFLGGVLVGEVMDLWVNVFVGSFVLADGFE